MDGALQAEGEAVEGDYGSDDKRGFRGTSENSKTKICMRFADTMYHSLGCLIIDQRSKRLTVRLFHQVESWTLSFW